MPIGVIIDSLSVVLGGLIGSLLGDRLPDRIKDNLYILFGLANIGMGISATVLMKNLSVVILSLIFGTVIGLSLHFGDAVTKLLGSFRKVFSSMVKVQPGGEEEFVGSLLTVLVLFCASATGIYGSLDAGFSGDHTILITKAILDFFTAMIFACQLGKIVSMISIPQFCIYSLLFFIASVIFPHLSETMIADFKGCGGFLMLATGLRLLKVKDFPLVDMVMALVIVMPISYLWVNIVMTWF